MSTRIATRLTQHQLLDRPGWRELKAGAKWCREKAAVASWESRVLPDVVLAGVQRSGTTALFEALYRLPMVERPRRGKGSHYFSYNYHRGWEWFQSQFPTRQWADVVEARQGQPMFCFDACPYYLFHPFAVERMAHALPDIKVMVMLRDPVRRAESHFHHSVSHGHETLSFDEALAVEGDRLAGEDDRMQQDWTYWSHSHEHHSYVSKGRYVEQLERLYRHYAHDQVMVIQSEAFYHNPNHVLAEVTEWLGLPPVELARSDDRNSHRYTQMDPAMRQRLVEVYREPNERLYQLIGRRYDWLS
ncbi:MAG: sulfotransferase domain-containing protein [Acidimicrobiia bacterium]|nr:sulfotransferase domain-containing protein [Acidimicrobiia bacterium]